MDGNKCDFCSNEIFSKQGIIENDIVRIIYPLKPIVFGHFMVITKRHAELFTDLNDTELVGMRELILKIYEVFKVNDKVDGFNLLNNNNKSADQHVPHIHIHVFMRKKGDVSPFDILTKKIEKVKLSGGEWKEKLMKIKSWFI